MRLCAAIVFSAAIALALFACPGGGTDNQDVCTPACGTGTVCKSGRCVVGPTAGLDASEVVIPPGDAGHDAGRVVNPVGDGGVQGCATDSTKAQKLPLDMYILLDQSDSMSESVQGGTKWDAVTGALKTFLGQPLTDVYAGLQYFPVTSGSGTCTKASCWSDSDCGAGCGPCSWFSCKGYSPPGEDSCTASDYAKPDVEIAALPGVASAISDSIKLHSPNSSTPTSAALQGGIDHALDWAKSHPQHVVIVVMATDGEPMECDTDLNNIDAIATAGVSGSPKVLTFVIGVGSSLDNLNGIASSGGTGQAFMVDTGGDVNKQFLDALNKIRGAALGCNYSIPKPQSGTPDYTKVNVQYTPGGGAPAYLPQVADKAQCPAGKDAWYYDDPKTPQQIILCDSTCTKVEADSTGEVDVVLGCETIIN
jgi:hypothetical protein